MNRFVSATAAAAALLAAALAPASAKPAPNALLDTTGHGPAVDRLAFGGVGGTGIEATGQSVAFNFVIKTNKASPKLMRTR